MHVVLRSGVILPPAEGHLVWAVGRYHRTAADEDSVLVRMVMSLSHTPITCTLAHWHTAAYTH